jgi:putative membrane protein
MVNIPYCGSPPVPGSTTWNFDPVVISALVIVPALYLYLAERSTPLRKGAFAAGWAVLALALVSPLCNLSVALFSARVTQHILLTLVAAPLLVLACEPVRHGVLAKLVPAETARAVAASILFALALWVWHLPAPYAATFQSHIIYWTMHATLFLSALVLWQAFIGANGLGAPLVAGAITMGQMSLLGAVLTFAREPYFGVHAGTTWPWGLSPLEDQELGGLIMWIPAGVLLTAYGLAAFALWMRRLGRDDALAGRAGASA